MFKLWGIKKIHKHHNKSEEKQKTYNNNNNTIKRNINNGSNHLIESEGGR